MSGSTFTWTATGTTGDWNTPSSWNPAGPPTAAATALFTDEQGNKSYTVNVAASDKASAADLLFVTKGASHEVTLSIAGTLTTGIIDYDANQAGQVDILPGGVLNVKTAINDPGSKVDTFDIAGTGAGGRMELGNLSVGAQPTSGFLPVQFTFQNAIGVASTGVLEFQSGFTTGVTTTQVVQSFDWGDSFVFDTANFSGDIVSYDTAKHILTVKSGSTTVLTMDNVFGPSSTTKFAAFNDVIQAICYVRGSMIQTPEGELPVEKLRPGKQVMTLVDGAYVPQTVKWLGQRRISLTGHPRPETVAPIRIQRDAVADGMPHRDLVVSPDHAIFIDGKLICARQLVNGTTIRQEFDWTAVDYYHVELDSHAILLAEGLPAESYIDTGNSGFFANSGAPLVLHPDLTDLSGYPTREIGSCAPFVWDEVGVRPVWERLAERAAAIGRPVPQPTTTTDPELRLRVRSRNVKPIYTDGNLAIFALPRSAREVRLVSRAQSPTVARPWLEDRRQLGVRITRIVIRTANDVHEVAMDHPGLSQGWWAVERDGQMLHRWTDGDAVLALPPTQGDAILEVHLSSAMPYVIEADPALTERRAA